MNVDTSLRPNHLAQRELTPEDLPQVMALHQLCTQGLSDDFVRKETMASLQSLMQRAHASVKIERRFHNHTRGEQ